MSEVYTVDIKHVEESDDLWMSIPTELMEQLGWEVGDDLKFIDHKDGSFRLKKIRLESVELEIPDDDLLQLTMMAHERNITLNDLITDICEDSIKEGPGYPVGNDADFGTSME